MHRILTFVFACLHIISIAQDNGARSTAMGDMKLGLSDLFSAVNNQAMLPKIRKFTAGINVHNQYLIKNLNTGSLAIAVPLGKGTIASNFTSYGYQLYQENKIGLFYAMSLSPAFSLGIGLNYHSLRLGEGLGMEYSIYPDIGLNYQPTDKLNIGIQFQNITLSKKVKQLDELWPVSGRLGLIYFINAKLLIGAQGNVYTDQPFEINSGLEYTFSEHFSFRFGFASQPNRVSLGIGFRLKLFQIDIASSYQANIGFTPSINLIFVNGR
jgi:hypothetical protein